MAETNEPIFYSLAFTGNGNSYATLPSGTLNNATTFTIEVKFSTTSTKSNSSYSDYPAIVAQDVPGIGAGWGICVNGGKLCFWNELAFDNHLILTTEIIVNDGEIHEVAVVSSSGSLNLYCDGELVRHINSNGKTSDDSSYPINIARQPTSNSAYLQMNLYELRFWSVARTAEQIWSGIDGSEGNLRAWYLPTEGALKDYSGNERHATLGSSVTFRKETKLYFDVECEIENDALGWRYEDVALYVGTGAPLNFHVPRAYELWIRFDVYFDGVNRWYAYCEGVTGIIAIEPATLVFMSRDNVVNQVEDACKIKQTQTILLHMKSGTSDGVIEVWSGYEKIGEYTGNVNDGAAFGDFILYSDGAGTSFTELIISNEEIQPDEKPSNATRATKTSMLITRNRKTGSVKLQPGGSYPYSHMAYKFDEEFKQMLTETSDSGEPVLIEIKSIWFKFDVYSDGTSAWQAYADGSSGKSGMSGLISGAVKLFANDADTDQFENICKANQWQTFILHMDSDATEGLIEAQVDGGDIYRWTGNVNNGEEFTDVYLTSDNDEVTFQNFIVSTAPLDFGDGVAVVNETPATEKIFFNVRHQGEVLSVPFVAESATPAVAIRWGGRNWFNQLVSPDDVDASAVTVRHGNEIFALSFGTFWQYVNLGSADDLIVSGTTLTDLPESKSRTGTAFYQTTRAKCFDLPATPEVWIKFDVFFDGSNRWRAYNGGDNGITGITAQSANTNLDYYINGEYAYSKSDFARNTLQTVLLHMISGSSDGVIEAWVDGSLIYRYTGDVNHGDDFAGIYLQSDGAGTFFSNLIISNAEIT